jgi:hypothetical protein
MPVSIRCSPEIDNRLTGAMISPVPGCTTDKSSRAAIADRSTTSNAMPAKSVAG